MGDTKQNTGNPVNQNFEIQKVTESDFDAVYPLLLEFNNPKITKELWKNLFADPWNFQKGHIGYKLLVDGRVVGFIAYLFSRRWLNNRWENFCNLSSWIVKKEFRKHKLDLLSPLLDLEDFTIHALSPSPASSRIFKRFLQLQTLDTHEVIIPLLITGPKVLKKPEAVLRTPHLVQYLTEEERRYYEHHQSFNCQHLLVKWKKEDLYLITKKIQRKHFPVHKIYYVNNPALFVENLPYLRIHLPLLLKSFGLVVDSRFLNNKRLPLTLRRQFRVPMLYKSKRLRPDQIDYLYTEYFLLDV